MAKQRPSVDEEALFQARVIPFERSFRRLRAEAAGRVNGRVIRPRDVIMLLPLIVPLIAAILLGLLGWFVAWLAIVGTLVAAIVFGDLMRGLCRRRGRALDRQAAG
jgi:hypothetical protein